MTTDKSTHRFEAEVSEVLRLVINSLYSHKEVFLRELISNASDALDKLRFRAVTESGLLPEGEQLKVRLIPDSDAGTLTVWDNGVGMDHDELVSQLGTVARSGTREFTKKLEQAKGGDVSLIGQFGVGFYSAWLVADHVEVVSRAAGSEQAHRWASDAKDTFTIEAAERECQGTSVILHLAKEHQGFLEPMGLRDLVQRYSDYLSWPIELVGKKDDEGGSEDEVVNRGSALWQRPASEVEDAQYEEFYKHLTHDWEAPLAHRHFKLEGTQEFAGLLFVPKNPPFDLFSPDSDHGVRLYVRRVFIMDHCEELLPKWLRFVRGVVDSEDLPLNVSREMLQDSRAVKVIRKHVVKQVLELLAELADKRAEDYTTFFKSFGAVLKEGLHFEPAQLKTLLPLLRYESSHGEGLTSLAEYKERMVEGQKAIYYALGESRRQVEASPHIEGLKARGYEVLFMTDPVDQWAAPSLGEFDGVSLVSATQADLGLEGAEEDKEDDSGEKLKGLRDRMRARLQEHVDRVLVSTRLTDSPVCLVVPQGGLQPHIERMLRATRQGLPPSKRIMEVNPEHPVIRNMERLLEREVQLERVDEWIDLLFEQALVAEGSPIEDPARFAKRLTALMRDVSERAVASA